jgi:hypothetical protein
VGPGWGFSAGDFFLLAALWVSELSAEAQEGGPRERVKDGMGELWSWKWRSR